MTDDLIPRMPSPSVREQFRKAAKEMSNRNPYSVLSDISKNSGATNGKKKGTTTSSAQVAPFVLPQQKAACGLKPSGSTGGSTKKVKRSTPMGVRLTEAQKTVIRQKAKDAGCNVNEYIRNLVLGGSYRSPLPPDVYRELLACKLELTRQGNNLNQIARQLNAGVMDDDEALRLLDELAPSMLETHAAIREALSGNQVDY